MIIIPQLSSFYWIFMKIIEVEHTPLDLREYRMRSALESDFTPTNLIKESCVLVDKTTGKQLVIYKDLDDEGFDSGELSMALQSINYQVGTRVSGLVTTSRIFGYSPRVPLRKDFCSVTSLAEDNPKAHSLLCEYGRKVVDLYSEIAPETYEAHLSSTEKKVRKEYQIEGTPFTSGIVNKNNPLKYHFDSGNFKDVYSCMLGIRRNVAGGYLALPEYDCALEIKNNSVTIFDGQKILHGVTPMKLLSDDAYRFTIVYYSLTRMWACLPIGEEIARIRNVKTARERKRATGVAEEEVATGSAELEAFKDVR